MCYSYGEIALSMVDRGPSRILKIPGGQPADLSRLYLITNRNYLKIKNYYFSFYEIQIMLIFSPTFTPKRPLRHSLTNNGASWFL